MIRKLETWWMDRVMTAYADHDRRTFPAGRVWMVPRRFIGNSGVVLCVFWARTLKNYRVEDGFPHYSKERPN